MKDQLPDFHQMHFDSIQALRGVTALFIVLEHVRFLNCGAFGVDIFFCISGFMIMFSTHGGGRHFLGKRLIRILPLYYLMTAGTFLLLLLFPGMFEQTRANPVFLLKSLLFIPFDIGGGTIQPLLRIGWTVNCEIFFYILFMIAMRISHRFRGLLCGLFLAGFVAMAHLAPAPCAFLAFYGNPVMLEFIFGMLCYYVSWGLYRRHQAGRLPGFFGTAGILGLLAGFFGLLVTKRTANVLGFLRPLRWGLPTMLMVLCAFLVGLCHDHGQNRKTPSPFVRLGDISFSLYLVHYYPVMALDRFVFDFSAPSPRAFFGVAVAFAVSICLAVISWALIERRLSDYLRRKLLAASK